MPRGDKSSYTEKQKRQAEHIEEGYEHRGVPEKEAERRAWATVNKQDHGGKKSGSGVGKARGYLILPEGGPPGRAGRITAAGFRTLEIGEKGRSHQARARTLGPMLDVCAIGPAMRLKRTPDEAAANRAEPKSLDELNAQIASAAPLVPGLRVPCWARARLGRPLRS